MKAREVHLRRRPEGRPVPEDFELVERTLPEPGPGEVLVRNLCLSVDPYMRSRMSDRPNYAPPYALDAPMTGGAIGRVMQSRHPDLEEGTLVESHFGWREAFRAPATEVRPLDSDLAAPPSAYLGVLGMPGMTAWVGLSEVGQLREGETVLVSGAAGAVGSVAGQIARLKGCRVLGSAGGPEKVRHLLEDLGFDFAFDYREGRLTERIGEGAPDGLDLYFDNVGGPLLEAALACMRRFGRIALCGSISQYNAEAPMPGPRNLARAIGWGLTLRGFLVTHHEALRPRFRAEMSEWVRAGRITWRETVVEGIEAAPAAFIGLFTGANVGKMIVEIPEPSL